MTPASPGQLAESMNAPVHALGEALRTARLARGLTIAALAEQGQVSPRLVSEFERGQRPHVSLETALRLLALVGVSVGIGVPSSALSATSEIGQLQIDRAARAAHRRTTWVGWKATVRDQKSPPSPDTPHARLNAVASASKLAVSLKNAHQHNERTSAAVAEQASGGTTRRSTGNSARGRR